MDLPRFNAIASDNYPPQTQWLDVLLGNNYKVISIQPLTRQIPNVREQRMWGLLSMDGCLLSRLLDRSSQVLGTIWRCLGKPRDHCGATLWRQLFLFPVIPIIALTHTHSYLANSGGIVISALLYFCACFCILLFCTVKTFRSNLYPLRAYGFAEGLIYVHDIV